MATTGVVNGTLIKVKLGGTAIANLKSNDESFKNNLIEITTKDSSGNAQFMYGKFEADINAEFLHVEGATNGYQTLFAAQQAKTTLSADITSSVSGDYHYSCSVLVSDIKRTEPLEDSTGVTVTFKVSGAVTAATV